MEIKKTVLIIRITNKSIAELLIKNLVTIFFNLIKIKIIKCILIIINSIGKKKIVMLILSKAKIKIKMNKIRKN